MTNRDIVSLNATGLRAITKDSRIPRRYQLAHLRMASSTLIAQKQDERKIRDIENLYSEITCLEFYKDDIVSCPQIEFRRCHTLMRSRKRLPELIFSQTGASIREIYSIDGNKTFELVTIEQYRRNKKRQHQLSNLVYVYYGNDGHLYVPDEEIYSLNVKVITMQTELIPQISECDECEECKSAWDFPFPMIDKLAKTVSDMALQTMLGSYKQIPPDENPDGNENSKQ